MLFKLKPEHKALNPNLCAAGLFPRRRFAVLLSYLFKPTDTP